MGMELTPSQDYALNRILSFSFDRPFFLGGFAGTGKTTILKALEREWPGKIRFLAPTGKACQVLKTKLSGSAEVQTIHSFLYTPIEVSEEQLRKWKDEADRGNESAKRKIINYENGFKVEFIDSFPLLDNELVVVDEASMIGKREFNNLSTVCPRIVFVGDPFQLPPVQSETCLPNKIKLFDSFLSEVHRAALESPITRLSMDIRSGNFRGWDYWSKNGIEYANQTTLRTLRSVDQVITGTNAVRRRINRMMRLPEKGFLPVFGDKVIIKENKYSYGKFRKRLVLVNGDIGSVKVSDKEKGVMILSNIPSDKNTNLAILFSDELMAKTYSADPVFPKNPDAFADRILVDYAYAITCHAAQGSEWKSVLVYDDNMWSLNRISRLRWLYTAVTRAKEKLVFIEKSC